MKKPAICQSLSTVFFAASIGLCLCLAASRAQAANVWWNDNGTGTPNNGTWDNTTANWALSSTLTTSTVVFTNGNFPEFTGGATTISALTISVPGAVSCAGMADGLSGTTVTTLTFSGTGPITIVTNAGTLLNGGFEQGFYCGGSGSDLVVFNTPITGAGGLQQHSSGSLELTGTNTYSGGTGLTGGQVIYYYNNSSFGSGPFNVGGNGNALVNNTSPNVALTIPNSFVFPAAEALNLAGGNPVGGAPGTTFSGAFSLPSTGTTTLETSSTATEEDQISGIISGAGSLAVSDAGILILSGANTYTGPTSVGGLASSTVLSVSSLNYISSGTWSPHTASNLGAPTTAANGTIGIGSTTFGGTFTYTGAGETSDRVINLAGTTGGATLETDGSGPLKLTSNFTATGAGVKTLTLQGSSTGANTISGIIVNNSSGNTTVVTKTQTGTWTLSNANTYTGTTTVNAGELVVDGSTASGSAVAAVTGGILGGTGTVNGPVNASGGGIISAGDPAAANGIGTLTLANNSASSLTLNDSFIKCNLSDVANTSSTITISGASGALVLNGANFVTLATPLGSVPAGTYTLMTYAVQTGTGTLALDRAYPNATLTVGSTSVTLTVAAGGITDLTWQGDGSANGWDFTATGDWLNAGVAATYADGLPVLFDDTSANNTVNVDSGTVSPASVEVNTSVKNYTISGSAIGGPASLLKYGTSKLTLSGPNTYSGATAIAGGTMSAASINAVAGGGASSSLGAPTTVASGTISIGAMSPAALVYTGAGETSDRVINLAGLTNGATIEMDGTGPLVFSSAFTATGAGAKSLTLQGTSTTANTIGGAIVDSASGATSLFKTQAGNWTLSGVNTFTGGVTNFGGMLIIGGAGQLGSGSYAGSISNNATFIYDSSASQTLSGVVSGTGTLSQLGSGNLTLKAAEIYTGGTTNGAGSTLIIGGTGTITATGKIVNNGTFSYNSTTAETISGIISGTGTLAMNSASGDTLTLSGVNTYTGITTINGGVLQIGADANLGAAPSSAVANQITLNGGTSGNNGLRSSASFTLSANRGITLGASGGAIQVASGDILTYNGIITGTGNFEAGAGNTLGYGTITLGGANNYSGSTTITCGTLQLGASGALPAGTPLAVGSASGGTGGVLNLNNFSQTIGPLSSSSSGANTPTVALGTSGVLTINENNNTTFLGAITGSAGASLILNASGNTLTLTGTNTYSNPTTISAGTLSLSLNGELGNGTYAGNITNNGIFNYNSTATETNAGVMSGAGMLIQNGPGTLTLTGTNTYTGGTSNGATLIIAGAGEMAPAGAFTNNGIFNYHSTASETLAAVLYGTGSLTQNGPGTLALAGASPNFTGSTLINAGKLIGVTGGGAPGSAVTVSSSTTYGVLITANTATWTSGPLTFNSGTTLDFNFGYSVQPGTSVAPLTVNGAAAFTGMPVVTIEAGNFPSGTGTYPLMTWTSTSGTPPSAVTLPAHVVGNLSVSGNTLYLNITSSTQPLRWTDAAANGLWDIGTSQNWDDNTGAPTDYLQTTIPGDAVVLDETYITAPASITLNTVVSPASVTVSNTIYSYAISGTGGIAGATGLTQLGSGSLTLACANTYTGPSTILGGTLIIGADANVGAVPASVTASSIVLSNATLSAASTLTLNANRGVTMLTNSTLDVTAGAQMTYSGIIAGPANLTKTSSGTLVLGGNNNSYSGNTIIASGIVQTGGDHNTGGTASNLGLTPATFAPTNITLAGGTLQGNNADFSFNTNRGIVLLASSGLSALNGDIMGIPGTISGNSSLTISNVGNGIVFLTGTNTYTGGTLVSLGLLSLQAGGSLSNSSMSIATGAGFDVSRLASTSYAMGGSAFTASGHGTVTNIGTATAAVINGAAGGTVSLGSLPVFLTFTPAAFAGDSTHPSLYLTQGALQLNGNAFTVNNASGTALGAGTYALIVQNGGAISSSGSSTVNVTGSGIVTGNTAGISVSGTNVNLVVTWQPPTIANPALTTNAPAGVAWKIAITNLAIAAGWSDPEGNPVTLSSVGPTSTNGISVTTDGIYIYYNGTVTVADQFGYVVTDGVLTASGNVNLVPVNPTGPSINNPGITINGNPTFSGNGIPGYVYGVESETSLTGPWIEAGNTTVGSDGTWTFTDGNQTNPPTIFYRLYYPDNPSNPPQ